MTRHRGYGQDPGSFGFNDFYPWLFGIATVVSCIWLASLLLHASFTDLFNIVEGVIVVVLIGIFVISGIRRRRHHD